MSKLVARFSGYCIMFALVSATISLAATPSYAISGAVIDSLHRGPIVNAVALIWPSRDSCLTDSTGRFTFSHSISNLDSLIVRAWGYRSFHWVNSNSRTRWPAQIELPPIPVPMAAIEVSGGPASRESFLGQRPVSVSGTRLREVLGLTLAETLRNEPGISEQSLGPAPARPVVRGLGGNRLLVVENGVRAGDLSASASDHAVVIDPATSEGIDVIRGPAALMYGSNTLGGVVNVHRHLVALTPPARTEAQFTLLGESCNRGGTLGGRVKVPWKRYAVSFDGQARGTGNLRTPIGDLNNSDLDTWGAGAGASYQFTQGVFGGAVSTYRNKYGIPGGYEGGHTEGVRIELERESVNLMTQWNRESTRLSGIETGLNARRYYHRETETNGACGVSFGVLTYDLYARAQIGGDNPLIIGLWSEYRDYQQGCLTSVPPTIERALAGYLYRGMEFRNASLRAALRVDHRAASPETIDTNRAGIIRPRAFTGLSGAIEAITRLSSDASVSATLMRVYYAPGVEELFADGPHLAAFAYEVGKADLSAESGIGLELRVELARDKHVLAVSGFYNNFGSYIFSRFAGNYEFGIGIGGRLPRYQFTDLNATLIGGELSAMIQLTTRLRIETAASYVFGELTDSAQPLTFIPPLNSQITVRHNWSRLTTHMRSRAASAQSRVGEFESPTAGYVAVDLGAEIAWKTAGGLHTLTCELQNVLDAEYRNHLSRIKSISPEPGRNLRILYRIHL